MKNLFNKIPNAFTISTLLLPILLLSNETNAQVIRCTDSNGRITYQDYACADGMAEKSVIKPKPELKFMDLKAKDTEQISLNYASTDIRIVMQVFSDFTNIGILLDDSVSGNISYRRRDVPWAIALLEIMYQKDLRYYVTSNNSIFIVPFSYSREEAIEAYQRQTR